MTSIEELTALALKFRDERDWAKFHKPKDVALSLMLEAAEVLEHYQWKNEEEVAAHVENARDAIGEELSDVLYWVLVMAHELGIELGAAFKQKMLKNAKKYPVEASKGKHTKYDKL